MTTVVAVVAVSAFGQFDTRLDEVDDLISVDRYDEAMAILETLEGQASGNAQRAEVYWRMSQVVLGVGDLQIDAEEDTDEILPTFERGEALADRAIEADPNNPLGYYWKAANIGKWGQTKGILDSLFKASPMRDQLVEAITRDPDHADSYYVLGQLYAKVPGVISFGNTDYAVSLARMSVDLLEEELSSGERDEFSEAFYIQLASHLIDRGWNERKRAREQAKKEDDFDAARTPLERGFHYEGTISIPRSSDADEAESILRDMIERLEARPNLRPTDTRRLAEAQELLADI